MNPCGKVLDIQGIQALGEEVNIAPVPKNPEKLFDIVRDLNNQRGRGKCSLNDTQAKINNITRYETLYIIYIYMYLISLFKFLFNLDIYNITMCMMKSFVRRDVIYFQL